MEVGASHRLHQTLFGPLRGLFLVFGRCAATYLFGPLRGPFLVFGRCAAYSLLFGPLRGPFLVFSRFAAHSLFARPTPPPGREGLHVRFSLQQGMDTLWLQARRLRSSNVSGHQISSGNTQTYSESEIVHNQTCTSAPSSIERQRATYFEYCRLLRNFFNKLMGVFLPQA